MHPHFAGDVTRNHMPALKLHTKVALAGSENLTLHLNDDIPRQFEWCAGQASTLQLVLKFAFFSRESYC